MIPEIAWKNCWRNKTRSLIIISAVSLGLFGGLLSSALNIGLGEQMIKSALSTRLAHIQIHTPGYIENRMITDTIPGAIALSDSINKLPAVKAVTYRIVLPAMASTAISASGVQLHGIYPDREKTVFAIDQSIKKGSYFASNLPYPVVIGEKLAESLELQVGSKVVLTFQGDSGVITGGAFRVAGIFETVSSEFDKTTAFVTYNDLSTLLGFDSSYTELAVIIHRNYHVDSVAARIRTIAPDEIVDTWKTLSPELQYVSESISAMHYIFMGVILCALAFGIVNTMLMAVFERQRELGVLMAIGMKGRIIFFMIVLETVFLSLTGAVTGMIITFITMRILSKTGVNLTWFAEGLREFGAGEILYPVLPWSMYGVLMVMVIVVAVLSAVYPARNAISRKPADALRL